MFTFKNPLRTPEPARKRRLADRVALAWSRFASRTARAADVVLALVVDEDVAAGPCRELRPATLERPVSGGRNTRGHHGWNGSVTTRWLSHV